MRNCFTVITAATFEVEGVNAIIHATDNDAVVNNLQPHWLGFQFNDRSNHLGQQMIESTQDTAEQQIYLALLDGVDIAVTACHYHAVLNFILPCYSHEDGN